MKGIRVRDGGFEGQCNYCLQYVPLEPEYWPMNAGGLRRCKACLAEYKRIRQRGYVASRRELYNAAVRDRRALMSDEERADLRRRQREWKARNREKVAAYNREYRQRQKDAA